MYGEKPENIFYYLTVYNEPILQPAEPEDVDVEGILRGPLPVLRRAAEGDGPQGADPGVRRPVQWALKAQQLLAEDWGVAADVWSATSWTELRRDARRRRGAQPAAPGRRAAGAVRDRRRWTGAAGPVVAVSDFMRAVPDLIAPWVPGDYTSLGTDGFGLSDTRDALRRHFHVDAESIVVAVLGQLAKRGEVKPEACARRSTATSSATSTRRPTAETEGGAE